MFVDCGREMQICGASLFVEAETSFELWFIQPLLKIRLANKQKTSFILFYYNTTFISSGNSLSYRRSNSALIETFFVKTCLTAGLSSCGENVAWWLDDHHPSVMRSACRTCLDICIQHHLPRLSIQQQYCRDVYVYGNGVMSDISDLLWRGCKQQAVIGGFWMGGLGVTECVQECVGMALTGSGHIRELMVAPQNIRLKLQTLPLLREEYAKL